MCNLFACKHSRELIYLHSQVYAGNVHKLRRRIPLGLLRYLASFVRGDPVISSTDTPSEGSIYDTPRVGREQMRPRI